MWLDDLVASLQDELPQSARRLLDAFCAVAPVPVDGPGIVRAAKQAVIDRLAKLEGGEVITADALRQRIVTVNATARKLAKKPPGKAPALSMRSTRAELELIPDPQALVATIKDRVLRSVAEDTASAIDMEQPNVDLKEYQVFVSHAHEKGYRKALFKRAMDDLEYNLTHLPPKWGDKFRVRLWVDHSDMRGDAESYGANTDAACRESALALFVLNRKWFRSKACQREAAFFRDATDAVGVRYLRLQLSGAVADNTDIYRAGPVYPKQWGCQDCENLLELYGNRYDEGQRDEFFRELADEICKALDRQHVPGPPSGKASEPAPRDLQMARAMGRLELAGRIKQSALSADCHDAVVLDRTAEAPRAASQEEGGAVVPLLDILMPWALDGAASNRIFALLGEFGAGKSTASQLFARALAREHEADPSKPFPVYLDFKRLIPLYDDAQSVRYKLPELLRHALSPDSATLDPDQLIELLRSESSVVIFDGLDEVGTRIGADRTADLYRQLMELVPAIVWKADEAKGGADWAASPLRILVTCRTHFFRDHIAQTVQLTGVTRNQIVSPKHAQERVKTLYLARFDMAQIESQFVKRLGDEAGRAAFGLVRSVGSLLDLAAQPVMTSFIAQTAPDLIEDHKAGRPVNRASTYGHMFRLALERDADKRPLLTVNDRTKMLKALALHLWRSRSPQIGVDALEDWFDAYAETIPGLRSQLGQPGNVRDLLHTELRNASLLVRRGEASFSFVHTSYYEYFLGRAFADALCGGDLAVLDAVHPVSDETLVFMAEQVVADRREQALAAGLDRLLESGRPQDVRQLAVRMRVAARDAGIDCLWPRGADLSGLLLGGKALAPPKERVQLLVGVSLRGAFLHDAHTRNITFDGCDFEGAVFGDSSWDRPALRHCHGTPRDIAAARFLAPDCDAASSAVLADARFRFERAPAITGRSKGQLPLRLNSGGGNSITSVAFSPDGATVLTGSYENTARLWDTLTGRELFRLEGHGERVTSVAFSPDGTLLLTGSWDKTARLWDTETGRELRRLEGHGRPVNSVAFSPDGATVLTGARDKTARLWDAATGREVSRLLGHRSPVTSVTFSPDGATLLTGSEDCTAILWDAKLGSELQCLEGHWGSVTSVAFSLNGDKVLTGSDDRTARIWDTANGCELQRFENQFESVTAVAFSPNGALLLTGGTNGTARLWDAATGRVLRGLYGHKGRVTGVAFSPDGATLLTGSWDKAARLWDAASGYEFRRLEGHGDRIVSVAFSPDSTTVLTGSCDKTARLWDTARGQELQCLEGHAGSVASVAFSPDGATVITGSDDGTARLWDQATGLHLLRIEGHGGPVTSVAFSPDSGTLITGSWDKTARSWDVATAYERCRFEGHDDWVTSVAFSPDGTKVLTGSDDGTARLWDAATGRQLRCLEGHGSAVTSVAISPNGATLLTGSWDQTARLWDVATGLTLRSIECHWSMVEGAAFSSDGTSLLTVTYDGIARLWDVATGQELRSFFGHQGNVASLSFSPNDKSIVTGGFDGTVRLWNVATGCLIWALTPLAGSWAIMGPDMEIVDFGPDAWRYVHAIEEDADGRRRVVCP